MRDEYKSARVVPTKGGFRGIVWGFSVGRLVESVRVFTDRNAAAREADALLAATYRHVGGSAEYNECPCANCREELRQLYQAERDAGM